MLYNIDMQMKNGGGIMEKQSFYMISERALPEVFQKVLMVKEMLFTGKAKDISEASKVVGLSRSTYYKYKDDIFPISEELNVKKITLVVLLSHTAGTLSKVLDCIAFNKGNVLTINQDIPINMAANVTITIDISQIRKDLNHLVKVIEGLQNVISVKVLAMDK